MCIRLARFNSSNFFLLGFFGGISDQDWAEGKVKTVQRLGVVDKNDGDVLGQVGKLKTKQQEHHKHLKEQCNVETIVGNEYEEIIIAIHDHYKEVFARASRGVQRDQTPALQGNTKTHNFS